MQHLSLARPSFVALATLVAALGGGLLTSSTSCGPFPNADGDAGDSEVAEDPPPPGCPWDIPEQEQACPEIGLQCEFGEADRLICNTLANCTESGWAVIPPDERCTGNDPSCPKDSFELERGGTCDLHGIICSWTEATCACEGLAGPGGSNWSFRWACAEAEEGCPRFRPRLGSRCFEEGQSCSYNGCTGVVRNVDQKCVDGYWRQVNADCSASNGDGDGGVSGDAGPDDAAND